MLRSAHRIMSTAGSGLMGRDGPAVGLLPCLGAGSQMIWCDCYATLARADY